MGVGVGVGMGEAPLHDRAATQRVGRRRWAHRVDVHSALPRRRALPRGSGSRAGRCGCRRGFGRGCR